MNSRQSIHHLSGTGNLQRVKADFAGAVAAGRLNAILWDNVITGAVTLPQFKKRGRDLIEQYLGYLPVDGVILPFEPYLRALLKSYWDN